MNTNNDDYADAYEWYAEQFDPDYADERSWRRLKAHKQTPPLPQQQLASSGDQSDVAPSFVMTYRPARFEAEWLLSSLRPFYGEHLVTDVLANIKGGKEASVYRCAADPTTGETFLAAKVYRPKQFRNLSNDSMYREGRSAVTAGVRQSLNKRGLKLGKLKPGALSKKTTFGAHLQHISWLSYEYATLDLLYRDGAAVPRPFAFSDNAILMSYHGDDRRAAPTLNEIRLGPNDAQGLFREALHNIELMLRHGLIHGDLSAYNILFWEGRITIIDFPQVTNCQGNSMAYAILQRDISRVCEYFARQGVGSDPHQIMKEFWQRYVDVEIPV